MNINTKLDIQQIMHLVLYIYIRAFAFFLHVQILRECFHGHKILERALRIWYYVHAKECEKYFIILNRNRSALIDK